MNTQDSVRHLLEEGVGQHLITNSAYDTAWIAQLDEVDQSMAEEARDWLRENQLADGSWGTKELTYHHERVICTLSAMSALSKSGNAQDRSRVQRGRLALERNIKGLGADAAGETIAFEMLVPTLLEECARLGIIRDQKNMLVDRLARKRAAKLASLPDGTINNLVSVAFSTEMVGQDNLQLLDVDRLQGINGSVGHSPAATAFFLNNVRHDAAALAYLKRVNSEGGVPYIAPIDVFERTWVLWNLALTNDLDDEDLSLCQDHLDFLEEEWSDDRGIPSCKDLTFLDGDATSLTYETLLRYGRTVNLSGVLHYEEEDRFRCFALEANPSTSTNIHVLGALRQAGLGTQHLSVRKVLGYLENARTIGIWFDKWHTSPYYPTSHAIITCAGYADYLTEPAAEWILETQNANGSWGYFLPTAEETAYCLQALVMWKRAGGQVPLDVLTSGAEWLERHQDPPYETLWIGKSLYSPILVVRSAVLSALALVDQEKA